MFCLDLDVREREDADIRDGEDGHIQPGQHERVESSTERHEAGEPTHLGGWAQHPLYRVHVGEV